MQLASAIGTLVTLGVVLVLWDTTEGGYGIRTLLAIALFGFCGVILYRYLKRKG